MSEENQWKTINVKPNTKKALEECKVHPNQSFDEILRKILNLEEKKDE